MFSSAQAVPKLQIYIPGAYYDMDSEIWIIKSYERNYSDDKKSE